MSHACQLPLNCSGGLQPDLKNYLPWVWENNVKKWLKTDSAILDQKCHFLKTNSNGALQQLLWNADSSDWMNWRKKLCINNESNGWKFHKTLWVMGQQYFHIQNCPGINRDMLLLAYFWSISTALIKPMTALHYLARKGIPIDWVDTYFLHSSGANKLALLGYLNMFKVPGMCF